jgi:hypothetical protein
MKPTKTQLCRKQKELEVAITFRKTLPTGNVLLAGEAQEISPASSMSGT